MGSVAEGCPSARTADHSDKAQSGRTQTITPTTRRPALSWGELDTELCRTGMVTLCPPHRHCLPPCGCYAMNLWCKVYPCGTTCGGTRGETGVPLWYDLWWNKGAVLFSGSPEAPDCTALTPWANATIVLRPNRAMPPQTICGHFQNTHPQQKPVQFPVLDTTPYSQQIAITGPWLVPALNG